MMSMKKSLNTSSAPVTADGPKGQRATKTFRVMFNKAKLDKAGARRLNKHPGFAAYLLEGVRRFSMKAPDYKLAQFILGIDFITPEEVAKARRGIVYTDKQIAVLAETIPSLEVLEWCKANSYVVMPAPPTGMSLLDVRGLKPAHFYTKTGGWYNDVAFATADRTSGGWLLIRKDWVPDSASKTWDKQNKLLSAIETVPNAGEMSWFITTYFEVRGIRLFEKKYVRTSSLVSVGFRVIVGVFDADSLDVSNCWDVYRRGSLGLASSRKLNSKS